MTVFSEPQSCGTAGFSCPERSELAALLALAILLLPTAGLITSSSAAEEVEDHVFEILEDYCFDCHDDGSKKGGFNLEKFLDEGE